MPRTAPCSIARPEALARVRSLPGPDPRRERTRANASGRAMEHGAVRGIAAAEVPALDAALKSFALAHAGDVHQFARRKTVHQHAVSHFRFVIRLFQPNLPQHAHVRDIRSLE